MQEFEQAQPLLQRVVDLYNQVYTEWLDFSGQTMRGTNLRMGHAMGAMKLGEQAAPIHRG